MCWYIACMLYTQTGYTYMHHATVNYTVELAVDEINQQISHVVMSSYLLIDHSITK